MSNWFYENSLSHHGVEGQKWGVMHGPPYPLTGENKKAFKADKKAYNKEVQRKLKGSTKYAEERYATLSNKSDELRNRMYSRQTSDKSYGRALRKLDKKDIRQLNREASKALKYTSYGRARKNSRITTGVLTTLGNPILAPISVPIALGLDYLYRKPIDEIYRSNMRSGYDSKMVDNELLRFMGEQRIDRSTKISKLPLNDTSFDLAKSSVDYYNGKDPSIDIIAKKK